MGFYDFRPLSFLLDTSLWLCGYLTLLPFPRRVVLLPAVLIPVLEVRGEGRGGSRGDPSSWETNGVLFGMCSAVLLTGVVVLV